MRPAERWGAAGLALAVAVGASLRLWRLGEQVVANDEWHSLHVLLRYDIGWLLTHFGLADHGIPGTLLAAALGATVGLDEVTLRLPGLLASLAAVALLPWLLREHLSPWARVLFAWLLAVAPLQVLYARYARPYAPAFLLASLAVLALGRWRAGGGRGAAAGYVVAAALAAWWLPVFAPFVLAPLLPALVAALCGRERRPREVVGLALATGAACALLLGPPIVVDAESMRARAGDAKPELPDFADVFELLSGTQGSLLGFGIGLALLVGLVRLARERRRLFALLAFPCAVQLAVVVAAAPTSSEVAFVFARYLLPVQLLTLTATAVGLERLDALARAEWPWLRVPVASVGLALALLLAGPVLRTYGWRNDFTSHDLYQLDASPTAQRLYVQRTLGITNLPPAYAWLARQPGEGAVLEVPAQFVNHHAPYAVYQRVHGRRVVVGMVGEPDPRPGEVPPDDPRFELRKHAHVADFDGLRERGVSWAVFHRRLPESRARRDAPRVDLDPWIALWRERVGEPVRDDGDLVLFRLDPEG